MAAVSVAPTTTSASIKHFWRKVQGPLMKNAFAHGKRKEKKFYDSLEGTPEGWSGYENTFTLDLHERGQIASIADSGAMAKPSSVDTVEATITSIHLNGRFNVGNLAQWADRGQANQIVRQITAQSSQKMDALVEDFSDQFWGFQTGLLATTNTDITDAAPTLTLATAFGVSDITNLRYMASLFKQDNDRVVLADSSNVLLDTTDSFGDVGAVSKANGTIVLALDGSITYSTNGIRIYKANNIQGTTLAGGSNLNRGLNGFLDIFTSTSQLGVSGSTEPNWNAAYSDTAAGRFTPTKFRRAKDEIENDAGLEVDFMFTSQGVYRDMMSQERAGLRYDNASQLTFDGDVKAKGVNIMTLKGCPPGYVFMGAKAALRKWEILPMEGDKAYNDLQAYQDYAASFGRVDWFGNMFPVSRKGLAYFSTQTES